MIRKLAQLRYLGSRSKTFLVIFVLSAVSITFLYVISRTTNILINTESPKKLSTLFTSAQESLDSVTTERIRVTPKTEDRPSNIYRKRIQRPAFVMKNKVRIYNVVDFSDQTSVDNLKPEYKREFIERRKLGMLDGIKLSQLEHLMRFLDLPRVSCKQRSKLIILVNSQCDHREKRDGIRQSWGNFSKSLNVNTVFFVGQCDQALVENTETNDIVQINFVDSYYNLTLKSLSRVKWFNEFCQNSDLVLFCDDDVLVDSKAILTHYPRYDNMNALCLKNEYMPILRDNRSKWYVPRWLLDGEYFPNYCAGFAYMFNSTVLPEVYEMGLDLPYIFVDDALVSGYTMQDMNRSIHNDERFILGHSLLSACDHTTMFASHEFNSVRMISAWKKRVETCKYLQ